MSDQNDLMPDPRSPQSCLWNLRIKDRWYRCRDPETLAVCEIDRPEALNKIKQICDQPDKLDEWEEAPFPAPLSSESGLVYTINMDAGTLDVAYFKKTEYSTHPRTNRYDLRAVYEASSWPSAICLERPQPLPAQQDSGKVMDDELAQPPLEPLHLELDFPTPVNVLQTRLYVNFLSVWRWHFLDSTTWSYDSRALNYFCFAILRLAAWDLEVSSDTDITLPMSGHAVPPWSCPEDNIYWYHGFLVVLHDSLEDQSKIRSAIQRAREYLERTTAARRRRHTRLIIMSPYHIVFAEITPDDTVRASSSSRLLLTSTGHSQRSGFRALCGILTSNCWPDTTAYREIWRNYLPWEIILHILSHLEPHDMAAFAQVSVPVKMMYYASLRQTIPQFASLTMLGYEPLIDCCGTRSGLEQSGVMCTVCYSCKHTGCLSVPRHLFDVSDSHYYICLDCRRGIPQFYPGPCDFSHLSYRDEYLVQHDNESKRLSLQRNFCKCKEYFPDTSCRGNVDFTIRFDGAFSGLAYGLHSGHCLQSHWF